MVKEIKYTSIKRVLDDLHDHPMLSDVTLERVVRYVVRFIELFGLPKLYQDRQWVVDIHEFRGLLPCDLISITQVKDCHSGICLRSMTDTFTPDYDRRNIHFHSELTFKTQGRVIFTSFPEGQVEIAYKAIPVDEDGFPMLIDNEVYLASLEAYIKKEVFSVKFDQGKISSGVLENAKQDYAWRAGQLQSELTIPSYSEMQSITSMMNNLVSRMSEFYNGFKSLGQRELLRKH